MAPEVGRMALGSKTLFPNIIRGRAFTNRLKTY